MLSSEHQFANFQRDGKQAQGASATHCFDVAARDLVEAVGIHLLVLLGDDSGKIP
jgi:hypothetical protein